MFKMLLIACFCFLFAGCATTAKGVAGRQTVVEVKAASAKIDVLSSSGDVKMYVDNTPARVEGSITIFSGTLGAKIYLDYRFIGTVPYEKPIKLVPGVHTVRVEKPCFAEYTDTFTIAPGESKEFEIDLFAFAGLIKVTSNVAGAVVLLDNKVLGTAPVEFEAGFGVHQVSLRKSGYKEAARKILVEAAETYEVNIRLVSE